MKNYSPIQPNAFKWLSLLAWAIVYSIGKDTGITWGDGLGYAMGIEAGYDLATNANSHFLYLFLGRTIFYLTGVQDVADVLGWLSVASSLFTLLLVFQIGLEWKNEKTALYALNILGSCFTFWRHACIIEVYNFALVFWAFFILGWLRYCRSKSNSGMWMMCISFALGILAHIQFVLLLPFWILVFARKRPNNFWPMISFLAPIVVVSFSVYVLKLNSLQSVFFDSIGDKLFAPGWMNILKGPFFIFGLSIVLNPVLFAVGLFFLLFKIKSIAILKFDLFVQGILLMLVCIFGFASLYPEAGIHVFLLPGFMIIALITGFYFTELKFAFAIVILYPFLQVFAFFLSNQIYDFVKNEKENSLLKWKGGSGYLFLPWARGNARSILEVAENYPIDSIPKELHWNFIQAKQYLKNEDQHQK